MNTNKILLTNLSPLLEKNLPKHSKEIFIKLRKLMDKQHDVLFDIGPGKRFIFSDYYKNFFYEISGTTPELIKKTLKQVQSINSSWKILNEPFNIISALIIRYYIVVKKQKEAEACLVFTMLAHYSSVQFKYFRFETNENIMTYTINNLSNKFYIKQTGVLYPAIEAIASKSHETYKNELIHGTDIEIINYIISLRNRIDSMINNIATEFYKNKENGNYINTEKDDYSEENFFLTDNTSFAIKRISDTATLQTVSRGVDHKYAKLSAKMSGVSVNAIRNAINDIVHKKDREINVLFTLILQLFLMEGKHTERQVSTMDFIVFCNDVYIKTNTTDKAIKKIKEILDKWLNESSAQYRKTERVATLSNYRKAIYFYCVFLLNDVAKGK